MRFGHKILLFCALPWSPTCWFSITQVACCRAGCNTLNYVLAIGNSMLQLSDPWTVPGLQQPTEPGKGGFNLSSPQQWMLWILLWGLLALHMADHRCRDKGSKGLSNSDSWGDKLFPKGPLHSEHCAYLLLTNRGGIFSHHVWYYGQNLDFTGGHRSHGLGDVSGW